MQRIEPGTLAKNREFATRARVPKYTGYLINRSLLSWLDSAEHIDRGVLVALRISAEHQQSACGALAERWRSTVELTAEYHWSTSGVPVDHRRSTVGVPAEHWRSTGGAPAEHQRNTGGAPAEHRWRTGGAPVEQRRSTDGGGFAAPASNFHFLRLLTSSIHSSSSFIIIMHFIIFLCTNDALTNNATYRARYPG